MEKPSGLEHTWCAVDQSTYERDREERLLLDELAEGDSVVLRRLSNREQPFAWDVFSHIAILQPLQQNELANTSFAVYIREKPEHWVYWVQGDGLLTLQGPGRRQEAGYLLGSLQNFDYELEQFLTIKVPVA